jgi:hypothetical protein
MNFKNVAIIIGIVVLLAVIVWMYTTGQLDRTIEVTAETRLSPGSCIPKKGVVNFKEWNDKDFDKIPWHTMEGMARSSAKEAFEADRDHAVQATAGFFKAMGLWPTMAAWRAYRNELGQYIKNDGSDVSQVMIGELSCV